MKKFIITGIQMRNKGSQAMFLSLYYGLKSIYKDCEVIGFAYKFDSPEQYRFKLLPYDDYTRMLFKYRVHKAPFLAGPLTYLVSRLRKTDKWNGKFREMHEALRDADAIFDASGYTLGSGWTKAGGDMLLQTIRIAKDYNTKIVLMPQSFGPFDWGEDDDAEFLARVKQELSYATKVYAREKEGYECLTSLGLDNVELSADIVLREKNFPSVDDILVSAETDEAKYPEPGSVGLILNENVFRVGDRDSVLNLYVKMLDKLVEKGEKVYILSTSTADVNLVDKVLEKTANRDAVELISGEYASPELIDIIARFKYVVASRYHSVVFAYKSGVPGIILGWATKYIDLAEHFQQQDYVFDIRKLDVDEMIAKIDLMSANHETEARRIRESLDGIQASSVLEEALLALGA